MKKLPEYPTERRKVTKDETKILKAYKLFGTSMPTSGSWTFDRETDLSQILYSNRSYSPRTTIGNLHHSIHNTLYDYWHGHLSLDEAIEQARRANQEQGG